MDLIVLNVISPAVVVGQRAVSRTPASAGRSAEPFSTLGSLTSEGRKLAFGQSKVPVCPEGAVGDLLGTLRAGEEVTVLEAGPSALV
ncbi:hypothetical protein [Streptomyces sp. NPDC051577]|uniref:hypothetical protein n=1 Tax=Streptomyces sp. NPDC051577 TaxID=3155166 RepID=UPI0034194E62